jgi:tRNA-splicing ligase RtcB
MPIKTVLSEGKVPVKIWADKDTIEVDALKQLNDMAKLPFVFKHIAVMPDVHLGKGATVGSVIATKNAICPASVGVDIGCGMMAVKTNLNHNLVVDKLVELRKLIEQDIPVGFNSNERIYKDVENWTGWLKKPIDYFDKDLELRALSQLGSLGGGNHFIEICLDKENNVWVMLHSGSRNVGKTLATRYINSAKNLMKSMFIDLPNPDLAYLVNETTEFDNYVNAVSWCQDYAFENRKEMMRRIMSILSHTFNRTVSKELEINCHHNYISKEFHFGENVYITRKGAVRARLNDLGIIPGSMGAKSFIVKGLGNNDSFHSCSHGAGRKMSRTQAKKQFTLNDLENELKGIECRKDLGIIDEIPSAYKNIDEVMNNQNDLVEILAELKQILCIKG